MASMLDFPLMLWVKLPVVDRILPQSTKCATGVDHEGWGGGGTQNLGTVLVYSVH